ncbi:MAG: hypothetical protein HEQ27_05890 [Dolichospermum sp. JUN01]|jgi:hypothetical protein|nr:hypothetical protein [Dolichospermum sp. JUN01]
MEFNELFKALDEELFKKLQTHLKDAERFVLEGAWQGQTYEEMANDSNYRYTPSYLKQVVGPKLWKRLTAILGESVCKTNFRLALERWGQKMVMASQESINLIGEAKAPEKLIANLSGDQQKVLEISISCCHTEDMKALKQRLLNNYYQLVALIGRDKIGKSTFYIKLAEQPPNELECLIQYSFHHPHSVEKIIKEIMQFFASKQKNKLLEIIPNNVQFDWIISIQKLVKNP